MSRDKLQVLCLVQGLILRIESYFKEVSVNYGCTRVWAWVTEYMQVSMLVNTMLCFNKRYLHIFNHPRLYPSTYKQVWSSHKGIILFAGFIHGCTRIGMRRSSTILTKHDSMGNVNTLQLIVLIDCSAAQSLWSGRSIEKN